MPAVLVLEVDEEVGMGFCGTGFGATVVVVIVVVATDLYAVLFGNISAIPRVHASVTCARASV